VTGAGFHPGPVTLAWSPGEGGATAIADAAGTFQIYVLVFPRDTVGPRQLVASQGGAIAAVAPVLVVQGTAQPGDFVTRR